MNIANIDNVHTPDARGLRQVMQNNTFHNNNIHPNTRGLRQIQRNDSCYNNKVSTRRKAEKIAAYKKLSSDRKSTRLNTSHAQ